MAKHKRLKNVQKPHGARATPRARGKPSKVTKQSLPKPKATARVTSSQHSNTIPFHAHDNILLIGEGDFSFSAALCASHGVPNAPTLTLTATTLESHDSLLEKHPQASRHIQTITPEYDTSPPANVTGSTAGNPKNTILYSVDATRLRKTKLVTRRAPYDRIVFNFPHVGGRSTDVNRQVRANQELIVGFLREAMALLRRRKPRAKEEDNSHDSLKKSERYDTPPSAEEEDDGNDNEGADGAVTKPPASILVTIFEGEPYTLWNVRDLARHVGLRVVRSFRFDWSAYPGYRHARTLGNLRGVEYDDDAEEDTGKETVEQDSEEKAGYKKGKKAWRGEDRPARMYEFTINEQEESTPKTKKKGKRDAINDSDDDT